MGENFSEIVNNIKNMMNSNNSNTSNSSSSSSNNNSEISPETISNLLSMLNSSNTNSGENNTVSDNDSNNSSTNSSQIPNIDFETILKFKNIMEKMNKKDDPRSNLLISLKPYLKESRKNKVDQYVQLLNIGSAFELFNNGGEKKK